MSPSHGRLSPKCVTAILAIYLCSILSSSAVAQPAAQITFDEFLRNRFSSTPGWDRERFCPESTSVVARRVLEAYGAMFAAHESIILPRSCVHGGEADVIKYHKSLQIKRTNIDGVDIDLQAPAAIALERAVLDAGSNGYAISAFDGSIAGGRTYGQTLMLWNSRFFPALEFWIEEGRLSEADRAEIGAMDLDKKIEKVLEWESRGIYFSTNRTRSILTSTAPPGTSQHLALLAFDVAEYSNADVRRILNQNGWFQTVIDDPPHFTYLGVPESSLPGRGLRAVYKGSYLYWVPNISTPTTAITRN